MGEAEMTRVIVDRADLEIIRDFLDCDDINEALKILNAVLKETEKK